MEFLAKLHTELSRASQPQENDEDQKFNYHWKVHEIIDAQLAFMVVLYACQVYGTVKRGPSFLKWMTFLIFAVEISTFYRGLIWLLPIDGTLLDIYQDFIVYPYFISHFLAYYYFAFKYWKSSCICQLTTIKLASQIELDRAQSHLRILQCTSMILVAFAGIILSSLRFIDSSSLNLFDSTRRFKEISSLSTQLTVHTISAILMLVALFNFNKIAQL